MAKPTQQHNTSSGWNISILLCVYCVVKTQKAYYLKMYYATINILDSCVLHYMVVT